MQRLIARFLLLTALVGNLAPLSLAASARPHACCIRKAVHRCHDSGVSEGFSEAAQLVIRDSSTCNHDCCRAVTTAQWAHARPTASTSRAQIVEAYLGQSNPASPNTEVFGFQSTRAPPIFSIA
jgi:hypothetical protein